jgi:hypothetical protein
MAEKIFGKLPMYHTLPGVLCTTLREREETVSHVDTKGWQTKQVQMWENTCQKHSLELIPKQLTGWQWPGMTAIIFPQRKDTLYMFSLHNPL